MDENVKSRVVLAVSLLLGGILAVLLVLLADQRGADETSQTASSQRPAPALPSAQPSAEKPPSAQTETNRADIPTVDFFGKPLDAFAIEVNKRVGIAGQVVMAGRPVPGATVVMRRVSRKIADGAPDYSGIDADPPGGQEWTTLTDTEGKFAFYGLDEGHFGLEARTETACGVDDMTIRAGSIPGRVPGKPAYFAGRAHMSIELWPSGALSGRVLAPDGQPVAGASVYPFESQSPAGSVAVEPIPQVMLGVRTAEDGGFHFSRLAAGRWRLAIRAEGYPDQRTEWLTTGEAPSEVRLDGAANHARISDLAAADSSAFNLSDYRGKYVLLDFWAAWCGPCRAETPDIKAVHEEFKDDPRFVLIGLNLDPNAEDGKKYISDNGMGWKHFFLGDWNGAPLPKQYRVEGIPCLILLDPEGRELARDLRGGATADAVRKVLNDTSPQGAEQAARPAKNAVPNAANAPAPKTDSPVTAPAGVDPADGVLRLNLDLGFDYRSEGFPMGLGAGQSDAQSTGERPCKKLSAEPPYHSQHVYYGYLRLGNAEDNRFVFAIDESDKSPWFGYFDRNNNADLTDDGPPCIISANVDFDVAIVLQNGKTVQRRYKIWQWPNNQSSAPCIRFYSVCHHHATLHLNGGAITAVAFEQYNHDGLYHDDGVWIDVNGDNGLDEKKELFKDGDRFQVRGKSYQVKLDYP